MSLKYHRVSRGVGRVPLCRSLLRALSFICLALCGWTIVYYMALWSICVSGPRFGCLLNVS